MYCSDHLLCSLLSYLVRYFFLWCRILVGVCESWLLPSFSYLRLLLSSTAALSQSVYNVCDNVESMMLNNQHILACGDFNIDMSDLNKPLSHTFHHFITSHSLTQPISSPTRYGTSSATILDLFLTTPDIPITSSSVLHHSFSNYLPICLQIKCAVPSPPPSIVIHHSFKHFSKSTLSCSLVHPGCF